MDKMKDAILIAIAKKNKGKEAPETESEEVSEAEDYDKHMLMIAEDLLSAIKSNDAQAVADLLKEAFECLEEYPHEEGPHLGE